MKDWILEASRGGLCSVALLLNVACGGSTSIDSAPFSQSTGGSTASPRLASWARVDWDEPLEEAAIYLWTGSPSNTWAVLSAGQGDGGAYYREHWDGMRLRRTVDERTAGERFDAQQVWAAAGGDAFSGSGDGLQRWSGAAWADWAQTPACSAIAGSAEDDVWCATADELWRWDGLRWTSAALSGIHGILANARDDVWVWGTQGASHFDGTRWSLELPGLVRSLSARDSSDVWAVQDGNVLHAPGPGAAWARQNPTGSQISAVWNESKDNTWIVGAGAAMRWDGSRWRALDLPARDELLFISGSNQDVWIGGTLKLLHGRAAGK